MLTQQRPQELTLTLPQVLQRALTCHQEGKLDECELLYLKIIEAQHDHFEARHLLGVLRYQQGRNTEALELIDSALRIMPNSAEALSNYGVVLQQLKRHEEALDSFEKALAIKPDYAEALNNRGNALIELKRYRDALASYDKALALKPDYAEALSGRGIALNEMKRIEQALGRPTIKASEPVVPKSASLDETNWSALIESVEKAEAHSARPTVADPRLPTARLLDSNLPIEDLSSPRHGDRTSSLESSAFRASRRDVIRENAAGSDQSQVSAAEQSKTARLLGNHLPIEEVSSPRYGTSGLESSAFAANRPDGIKENAARVDQSPVNAAEQSKSGAGDQSMVGEDESTSQLAAERSGMEEQGLEAERDLKQLIEPAWSEDRGLSVDEILGPKRSFLGSRVLARVAFGAAVVGALLIVWNFGSWFTVQAPKPSDSPPTRPIAEEKTPGRPTLGTATTPETPTTKTAAAQPPTVAATAETRTVKSASAENPPARAKPAGPTAATSTNTLETRARETIGAKASGTEGVAAGKPMTPPAETSGTERVTREQPSTGAKPTEVVAPSTAPSAKPSTQGTAAEMPATERAATEQPTASAQLAPEPAASGPARPRTAEVPAVERTTTERSSAGAKIGGAFAPGTTPGNEVRTAQTANSERATAQNPGTGSKPTEAMPQEQTTAAPATAREPKSPSTSGYAFRHLAADEVAMLVLRGEDFIGVGDIPSARLVLQRAAESGDPRAALVLGGTYDPLILENLKLGSFTPDVTIARTWYERAKESGSAEASRRLEMLANRGH